MLVGCGERAPATHQLSYVGRTDRAAMLVRLSERGGVASGTVEMTYLDARASLVGRRATLNGEARGDALRLRVSPDGGTAVGRRIRSGGLRLRVPVPVSGTELVTLRPARRPAYLSEVGVLRDRLAAAHRLRRRTRAEAGVDRAWDGVHAAVDAVRSAVERARHGPQPGAAALVAARRELAAAYAGARTVARASGDACPGAHAVLRHVAAARAAARRAAAPASQAGDEAGRIRGALDDLRSARHRLEAAQGLAPDYRSPLALDPHGLDVVESTSRAALTPRRALSRAQQRALERSAASYARTARAACS
jgi:hypothetical protein